MLSNFFKRLTGGGSSDETAAEADAVEYSGFRIRPAPYAAEGQFQTAGTIEKNTEAGLKVYKFVRAEKHASKEAAADFSVVKARQIIDEQGERVFDKR